MAYRRRTYSRGRGRSRTSYSRTRTRSRNRRTYGRSRSRTRYSARGRSQTVRVVIQQPTQAPLNPDVNAHVASLQRKPAKRDVL